MKYIVLSVLLITATASVTLAKGGHGHDDHDNGQAEQQHENFQQHNNKPAVVQQPRIQNKTVVVKQPRVQQTKVVVQQPRIQESQHYDYKPTTFKHYRSPEYNRTREERRVIIEHNHDVIRNYFVTHRRYYPRVRYVHTYYIGDIIPQDVVYYDLPPELLVTLQPVPSRYRYVIIDNNVYLVSASTFRVIAQVDID